MKKIKILMVCGAGLGSSLACEMIVEEVIDDLKIKANLEHSDISSAKGYNADIIITASNFQKQFEKFSIDETKTKLIYLKNIVSKVEIKDKLVPVLTELEIL